jgi:hypothetical protein
VSEEFDDPELKQIVSRVWSAASVPPRLEAMVAAHLATPGWRLWIGSRSFGATVAATALALIGVLVIFAPSGAAALPKVASVQFVQTHDRCCKLNDHHFVPPEFASEMAATGRWLSSQVHIPVLAVNLNDGWDYCGAGPCKVGANNSGHLLFKRGKEDLSIFSIPADDFERIQQGRQYDADEAGHGLAAFTRDGGLYCVVGRDHSGYADINSVVRGVRKSLMRNFRSDAYTAAGPGPVRQPALAVLLND